MVWTRVQKGRWRSGKGTARGTAEIRVPLSARPLGGPKTQDSVSSSMTWEAGLTMATMMTMAVTAGSHNCQCILCDTG